VNADGKEIEKCGESFVFWSLFIWQIVYLYSQIAISMQF